MTRIVVAPGELREAALTLRSSSDAYWEAAVRLAGCRCPLPSGWDWALEDLSAVRAELAALSRDLAEAARTVDERARLVEESDSPWCSVGSGGLAFGATLPGGERVEVAAVSPETSTSSMSGPGLVAPTMAVIGGGAAATMFVGAAAANPGLYPTEMVLGGTAPGFSLGVPVMGTSILGGDATIFGVGAAYGPMNVVGGSGGSPMEMLGLGQSVGGGNPWYTPEMNDIRTLENQLRQGAMSGPAPRVAASDPAMSAGISMINNQTLSNINTNIHNINAINSPTYVTRNHFTSDTNYETYNGLQ